MWIQVHQNLRQHPKLIRAARYLDVSRVEAVGHLVHLWLWCVDYAPDGDLSAFDHETIAAAAEYAGDAERFVQALVEAAKIGDRPGFLESIDGRMFVHDWQDYGGRLQDRRERDAERKRGERSKEASAGRPQDIRRTSAGRPQLDKSRVDKKRIDKTREDPPKGGVTADAVSSSSSASSLCSPDSDSDGVTLAVASALADVCSMVFEANQAKLISDAKTLIDADPGITAAEVRVRYGPGGWWWSDDWRGKKGDFPAPANIRETWGQWSKPKARSVPGGNGHRVQEGSKYMRTPTGFEGIVKR